MIIGYLMGGLGNQLFQIFATISYATKNKHKFLFPLNITPGVTNRHPYWKSFMSNLKNFTINQIPQLPLLREKGFEYEEIMSIPNEDNAILYGYFQSYKYFEDTFTSICRLISLDKQKAQLVADYPNNYSNIISMHFRLGDYKNLPNSHPVLPYEYYLNSLHFLLNATKRDDWNVLYFCEKEDNEEVFKTINALKLEFPKLVFVKQDDSVEDWKQMLMMSICAHNIIANSTFSWWGAYFNTTPSKIVCYPELWFGPALKDTNNTKDLFPNEWTKTQFL
jgi:hypothetical protein